MALALRPGARVEAGGRGALRQLRLPRPAPPAGWRRAPPSSAGTATGRSHAGAGPATPPGAS
eukprot:8608794-Lingulodinium_polyedra.AAC.1